MLKSDFLLDQDLITQISRGIAESKVDLELVKHPELISQRDKIKELKEKETKLEINNAVAEVVDDLQLAGRYLSSWFQNLPPEKRESLRKEFKRADEIILSEWFLTKLQKTIENPTEQSSPLQKVLKLSNETLQSIYAEGCSLQKKADFVTSKALFRFLAFLNPGIADFWICLGFSLTNLHHYKDAEVSYYLAASIDPANPQSVYFSALNWTLQKEYEKAMILCESCLTFSLDETWKQSVLDLKNFINSKNSSGVKSI